MVVMVTGILLLTISCAIIRRALTSKNEDLKVDALVIKTIVLLSLPGLDIGGKCGTGSEVQQ